MANDIHLTAGDGQIAIGRDATLVSLNVDVAAGDGNAATHRRETVCAGSNVQNGTVFGGDGQVATINPNRNARSACVGEGVGAV
jgi:hypothetical protein